MARAKIDELNILSSDSIDTAENNSEAFDYHDFIAHYFDSMKITDRQKKERQEASEEIFDAILLFLMWCENAPERVQEEETQRSFENMYKEVLFQFAEPDDYLDEYVALFIPQLIKVTLDHQGEEYFTSVERAAFNAVNESNTLFNHIDIEKAKLVGFTKKTWIAEVDDRTREDHLEMNGWTIPIDDYFIFEDCMMLFPHDYVHGTMKQLSNCRCSLKFS